MGSVGLRVAGSDWNVVGVGQAIKGNWLCLIPVGTRMGAGRVAQGLLDRTANPIGCECLFPAISQLGVSLYTQ